MFVQEVAVVALPEQVRLVPEPLVLGYPDNGHELCFVRVQVVVLLMVPVGLAVYPVGHAKVAVTVTRQLPLLKVEPLGHVFADAAVITKQLVPALLKVEPLGQLTMVADVITRQLPPLNVEPLGQVATVGGAFCTQLAPFNVEPVGQAVGVAETTCEQLLPAPFSVVPEEQLAVAATVSEQLPLLKV